MSWWTAPRPGRSSAHGRAGCFDACSVTKTAQVGLLLLALLSSRAHAGEEDVLKYVDVVSVQSGHWGSWDIRNVAINSSRYFVGEGVYNSALVFPGYGVRIRLGSDPQAAALAKLGYLPLGGIGVGPAWGREGIAATGSVWLGLGCFGGELSTTVDRGGLYSEAGIFLAAPFGEHRNGKYGFVLFDFWRNFF